MRSQLVTDHDNGGIEMNEDGGRVRLYIMHCLTPHCPYQASGLTERRVIRSLCRHLVQRHLWRTQRWASC